MWNLGSRGATFVNPRHPLWHPSALGSALRPSPSRAFGCWEVGAERSGRRDLEVLNAAWKTASDSHSVLHSSMNE